MTTRNLILLKAGSTFPDVAARLGDFDAWLLPGLNLPADRIDVVEIWRDAPLPEPETCAAVIMTGAHAMLTDRLPWMRRALAWLPRLVAAEVPFLGICFGHQMLAEAMGGRVDFHPKGREIGCVDLNLYPPSRDDRLFHDLPARFPGLAVHAQSVSILPPDAVLLAGNEFEPHHAFRVGDQAWGIQFHPEFNQERMNAYVHHLAQQLCSAGQDCEQIRARLCDTPIAASLLPRFAAMARARFT
ncbi:MAG: glutamine amidotransferase [Gallionellaceae bacterium]|nr:glutamine amidotransferase [Gallionellaceae bacterium]